MSVAFTSFKTKPACTDASDYGCLCPNPIYAETYAMTIQACDEPDRSFAWKAYSKKCKSSGFALNSTLAEYLALGEADHLDATADKISKKTVVDKAVKLNIVGLHQNYLTRVSKTHVLRTAETYVNILNAYWGLLTLFAFIRLVALRLLPTKKVGRNAFVTYVRKVLTLPATFGGRHIYALKIGRFSLMTLALRWQTIVITIFFCLNIIFLFVDIKIIPNQTIYYTDAIEHARFIGDKASIMSIGLVPFVYLFAGRNNIMMYYTGWSFETFNVFHKAIARVMVINAFVHGWTYTYAYGHLGEYKGSTYWEYLKEELYYNLENRLGIVAAVIAAAIILFSFYVIRHNWYETFLLLHQVLVIVFTATTWHHVKEHGYVQYVYAAVAVWAFDRLIRILRVIIAGPFAKAQIVAHGDAVQITAKTLHGWKAKPGQYAFLYLLRHNFWESHPFSIVETKKGNYVFVAKKHAGLTHKIHSSVDKLENKVDTVSVWIEGPYGDSYPLHRYETVLLVAGGIGITAIMSYVIDLKRRDAQQHVIVYWMVREQSAIKWVKEQLEEVTSGSFIEFHIYVTGENNEIIEKNNDFSESSTSASSSASINNEKSGRNYSIHFNERPNVQLLIADTVFSANGSVAIVSCGPGSLADTCRAAATENVDKGVGKVDYFEDAFSWA
ncbi:ferric reductase NAD binding domain-containing protein [Lipomyces japonicus]|uniref:ferric reductase NAD binding domain-containing protein n=1 Tax=Lipomyces japonicus TaxID=56871 RepID=UPI0034CF5430